MNSKLHHDIKQENELQNLSIYKTKSSMAYMGTCIFSFNCVVSLHSISVFI